MTGNPFEPLRPGDPQMLGSYQTAGRIGRGGMGVVYAAYGPSGERVAVKVINPDLADDESFRVRFRREVEAARRVRQFCTAPVLDAQLEGEPLYIVTEYIDGPDLNQFLQTQGPMRGSSLEHLSVGVATALAAIHGAGIVHRDLKPANVLLSPLGPRVIDFGIARALDAGAQVTRTGQFIGTPSYMAPELINGGQSTPASDVFAWGCLVAHAATGKPPFSAPSVPAILQQIMHGVADLEGFDDLGLRAVVERALDRDPAKRPSAQELLNLLVGQENADTAKVADTVDRGWTEVRATRIAAPPTAFLGSGPPPGPVAGVSGGVAASGSSGAARWRWLAAGVAGLVVVLLIAAMSYALSGGDGPPTTITLSSDDFGNQDSGWSRDAYKNNALEFHAGGTTNSLSYSRTPFNGTIPDRMMVTVDVTPSGADSDYAGIMCSETEDTGNPHGYAFTVRFDGGLSIAAWTKTDAIGNRLLYATESAAGFRKGAPMHLQAACEKQDGGMRLRLWLNGTLAADTFTKTQVDAGPPALFAGLGGTNDASATVDFRHFQLGKVTG